MAMVPGKPAPAAVPPPATPRKRGRPAKGAARQPGRPAGQDGALREALVEAALHAFATDGYAASTLRGIATAAGVTPAMAHYYFGDKAGLLAAVVELRVQPLTVRLAARLAAAGDDDPMAGLRAFVETYPMLATEHPWIPRLVLREVLGEGGVLRETFARRFAPNLGGGLVARIRAAQAQGRIDPALDPARVALSLLSLCIFPVLSAPVIPVALGIPVEPGTVAAHAAHTWRVFLSGVEPRP
jgi:TetR/AcrR family transcriptional regulator